MENIFKDEQSKKRVLQLLKEYGKIDLLNPQTKAEELNDFLDIYNWDDGFEIPYYILEHQNCELGIALKLFYLSDGLGILDDDFENDFNKKWVFFVKLLYKNILEGKYQVKSIKYQIPLDEEDKKELEKFPEITRVFLDDVV